MTQPNPDYYPPDGREWVEAEEIEELAAQDEAMMLEQYIHEVATLRRQFFGKLLAHGALKDGLGWAIFDDETQGSVAELESREVLLLCGAVEGTSMVEYPIPLIRIITNEPYVAEDAITYISEDVTVKPDGTANYFIDAIRLEADNPSQQSKALKESSAPLFIIRDGRLRFTENWLPATPSIRVTSDSEPNMSVRPFGDSQAMADNIYALSKARAMLDSISDLVPLWHHES